MKRILLFFLAFAAMPAMMMAAEDALTISVTKSGVRQWELTAQLNNPNGVYSGFQIDFQLPKGIALNTASVASAARTESLTIQASVAANGLPRVVGYANAKANDITGTSGTIFTVNLDMDEGLPDGEYDVVAKNVRLTTADGVETVLPNATCVLNVDDVPIYKLTFWNENTVHYTVMLPEGVAIPEVEEPAPKEGYSFCGWGEVPATMPAANLELWAAWCVNYYEVSFVVDDEVFHSEQVAYGSPLPEIEAPELSGYFFLGWEGEQFDTMPAKDVTYVAKYAKIGDVNQDGEVNTSDVVAIYNYIVEGGNSGVELLYADVNGDGEVNTSDVTMVYNIITNGE